MITPDSVSFRSSRGDGQLEKGEKKVMISWGIILPNILGIVTIMANNGLIMVSLWLIVVNLW